MQVLCLNDNEIKRLGVDGLSNCRSSNAVFPRLTVLHLANNMLSDVMPLELHRFPALTTLFLHHNALTSTCGIDNVVRLTHLVLDRYAAHPPPGAQWRSFQDDTFPVSTFSFVLSVHCQSFNWVKSNGLISKGPSLSSNAQYWV